MKQNGSYVRHFVHSVRGSRFGKLTQAEGIDSKEGVIRQNFEIGLGQSRPESLLEKSAFWIEFYSAVRLDLKSSRWLCIFRQLRTLLATGEFSLGRVCQYTLFVNKYFVKSTGRMQWGIIKTNTHLFEHFYLPVRCLPADRWTMWDRGE